MQIACVIYQSNLQAINILIIKQRVTVETKTIESRIDHVLVTLASAKVSSTGAYHFAMNPHSRCGSRL